ncbi:Maf family protein [Vulgatibacter incomptus]|uniref:dTTP/UTP pyrophosphatase n=1 Tax=Vulgatibacter incomptus TaxID=1391653 RepID=A0A0K1PDN3_9BACT|nr:Maf family protein [Vulgatibacter incomptus]AKU91209.1 Septum formation protein Maf [Vulgatibacter incomptus]
MPDLSPPFLLASASPRRRELLAGAGFSFVVAVPGIPEDIEPGEAPDAAALRLAGEKAEAVRVSRPDAVVLAADTVVVLDGRALGKPRDPDEARAMLLSLSGRTHEVVTGVSIRAPTAVEELVARTQVRFRPLEREEIDRYVATGEPMDKAGAYGIQGGAASFVEAISGSYTNVVGLPLAEAVISLRSLGVLPG